MIALRLERFGREPDATWGRLSCVGTETTLFTVERPWVFNRRFNSCIPDGLYGLERHDSTKFPQSWAMVGPGVSHQEEPGTPRYACLIHAANWRFQLEGCIAPGESIAWLDRAQAVTNSRKTLSMLDEILLELDEPQIEIVSCL